LVGKQALHAAVRGMYIDCEKLPLYKIKRHRLNSALAQLAEMQNLLRKVEYVHKLTVSMHTCILHVCFYVDMHVFFWIHAHGCAKCCVYVRIYVYAYVSFKSAHGCAKCCVYVRIYVYAYVSFKSVFVVYIYDIDVYG
jgi:hypothetical protein